MERFNDFFTRVDLSAVHDFIMEHGEYAFYRRGDIICNEGEVCPAIALVKNGYFKFSVIDSKGEVCITGFSMKGEIATDYVRSFLSAKPSFTAITSGCDSTVIQAGMEQTRAFIAAHHAEFNNNVAPIMLAEAYRRYLDLHTKTAKERYIELSARCHGDLSMIPLQEIASYLSISRRQLQRIRESFPNA